MFKFFSAPRRRRSWFGGWSRLFRSLTGGAQ